jgi:hypothetical protein
MDADGRAQGLRHYLEVDWNRSPGAIGGVRAETFYWREETLAAWHLDGGQGSVNEAAAKAHAVVAVFDRALGTPWGGYESGTVAEVEIARKAGKPVRVYVSQSGPGRPVWEGPDDREPALREVLRRWVEVGVPGPDGVSVPLVPGTWERPGPGGDWAASDAALVALVGRDLSNDVADGTVPVSRLGLSGPVLVGDWQAPPAGYLPRRPVEDRLAQVWAGRATGGRNAAWLHGAPGAGKTMVARRIADQALQTTGPDREEIIMWVDSADPAALTAAYLKPAEQVPALGVVVGDGEPGQARHEAAMQVRNKLAGANFRWLVVLDNANPAALTASGLLPPNTTKTGRVLATTIDSDDHFGASYAAGIPVGVYDPEEATEYVKSRRDPRDPAKPAALAQAPDDDIQALIKATGRHPLALAIDTATITAHPPLTIPAWLEEFNTAPTMDSVTDELDPGGHQATISKIWQVALDQAGRIPLDQLVTNPDPAALADPTASRKVLERAATVAALLDPDGHPNWLWDRQPVQQWVAQPQGAGMALRHGQPEALTQLARHNIITPDHNTQTIAIHQLAAQSTLEPLLPHPAETGPTGRLRDLAITLIYELADPWPETPQETEPRARNLTHVLARFPAWRHPAADVAQTRCGDHHQSTGNLPAARKSHQESLDIRRELADLQPGSVEAHRDLSV